MSNTNLLKAILDNQGGRARGNRFQVLLPPIGSTSASTMAVLCKSVNLPGQQILTGDRSIGITDQKVAYGYLSDDVSMSFILTNDHYVRDYFIEWQNLSVIRTEEAGFHYPRYKNEYVKEVKIQQLDMNNRIVYVCTLVGAFPTTIEAIPLSDDNDNIIQLNVQLSYTRWYDNHKMSNSGTIGTETVDTLNSIIL